MKDLKTVLLIALPVLGVAVALLLLADPFDTSPSPEDGPLAAETPAERKPIPYEEWLREQRPRGITGPARADGVRPPPEGGELDILTLDLLKELLEKGDSESWMRIRWLFQYGVVEDPVGAQALLVKALETDENAGVHLEQIFPLVKDEAARKLAREGLLALARATEDVNVLKGAVRSLGILGDGQTAVELAGWLQGLSTSDPKYREKLSATASAIAAIGAPESATALAELLVAQHRSSHCDAVIKAIGRLRSGVPEMVEALAPLLGPESSRELQQSAARALGYLGAAEGAKPLRDLFEASGDPEVKQEALVALGRVGTKDAVNELIRVMEEDESLGFAAGMAMRSVDRQEAVQPILEKLDEVEDPRFRANMICALGNAEDPAAAPKLRLILESGHENEDARRESALALGKIGDVEAVDLFASRLSRWQDEDQGTLLGILAGATYMTQKADTHKALNDTLLPVLRSITEKPSTTMLYFRAKETLARIEAATTRPPGSLAVPREPPRYPGSSRR